LKAAYNINKVTFFPASNKCRVDIKTQQLQGGNYDERFSVRIFGTVGEFRETSKRDLCKYPNSIAQQGAA
jgi:hypothetical protein